MNARKRRLAKRRRAVSKVRIGRYRLALHYVRRDWTMFYVDGYAAAVSPWGYAVQLWYDPPPLITVELFQE